MSIKKPSRVQAALLRRLLSGPHSRDALPATERTQFHFCQRYGWVTVDQDTRLISITTAGRERLAQTDEGE